MRSFPVLPPGKKHIPAYAIILGQNPTVILIVYRQDMFSGVRELPAGLPFLGLIVSYRPRSLICTEKQIGFSLCEGRLPILGKQGGANCNLFCFR